MKKFVFKAKNWQGKTIKGVAEAETRKGAVALLKEKDLVILSLTPQRKSLFAKLGSLLLMRVSLAQLVTFTRQLATMINAGLPLSDALSLIKDQSKGKMRDIIDEILAKIEGGSSLAKALEKEKKIFGDIYLASIRAGEKGGVLEKILLRLADNLEGKKEFVGRVKGAMIYPIIVIIGMILVAIIMMVLVMPKMTVMYAEFGTEMPLPTRILMGVSEFVSKNLWIFPIIPVALFVFYKILTSSEEGRIKRDQKILNLPIIGRLVRAVILTDITRTLGTLLGTGVPLVDALEIVADASGNEVFKEGLHRASKAVEKGLPLSESLSDNPVFPPILIQMVSTGEQTGKMDEILSNVSRYFETEADQGVKALTTAIEPLIMILLGIGVGFLVIAVIMPIYNLTSQF